MAIVDIPGREPIEVPDAWGSDEVTDFVRFLFEEGRDLRDRMTRGGETKAEGPSSTTTTDRTTERFDHRTN